MDAQKKKWITGSLIGASVLTGFVLHQVLVQTFGSFNIESRLTSLGVRIQVMTLAQIISIVLGLATFAVLSLNRKVNIYMEEVVAELAKVTWPTSTDASKITVVVIIMVLICGAVFAVQDGFWVWIMNAGMSRLTGALQ